MRPVKISEIFLTYISWETKFKNIRPKPRYRKRRERSGACPYTARYQLAECRKETETLKQLCRRRGDGQMRGRKDIETNTKGKYNTEA